MDDCSIVVNPECLQSTVTRKRKTAEEKRVSYYYNSYEVVCCSLSSHHPNQITSLQQAKVEAGRIAFQHRSHGGGLTNLVRDIVVLVVLTLYLAQSVGLGHTTCGSGNEMESPALALNEKSSCVLTVV